MPTVLSIGQCGFDDPRIAQVLRQHFHADTDSAATADEAATLLAQKKYDLVLINRILDADGSSGLALLAHLKNLPDAPPLMLVSNYEDAQEQAIAAGALPGVGKSNLSTPQSLARLKAALTQPQPHS